MFSVDTDFIAGAEFLTTSFFWLSVKRDVVSDYEKFFFTASLNQIQKLEQLTKRDVLTFDVD
jgi:hypothetical protein